MNEHARPPFVSRYAEVPNLSLSPTTDMKIIGLCPKLFTLTLHFLDALS